MVDLHGQYLKIKEEIDQAIQEVINSSAFINGKPVEAFSEELADYLGVKHAIVVSNGTAALHIAVVACLGEELRGTGRGFALDQHRRPSTSAFLPSVTCLVKDGFGGSRPLARAEPLQEFAVKHTELPTRLRAGTLAGVDHL